MGPILISKGSSFLFPCSRRDRTYGPQVFFAPSLVYPDGHTISFMTTAHVTLEMTSKIGMGQNKHIVNKYTNLCGSVHCKGNTCHHTRWQCSCWQASGQPVVEELCLRQGRESLGEIQPPGPPEGACHPAASGSSCSLSPLFSASADSARVGVKQATSLLLNSLFSLFSLLVSPLPASWQDPLKPYSFPW